MRKSILSLALILATYASAGDKQPYHVNIYSGINVFDDISQLENGSLVGLSATFYERETQSYALQLGYEHLGGIAYEGIVLDTDLDRYYMNMIVDGEEELNITPYILLGGGYENVSRVYEAYHDTQSQAFINAGLGFKYRISDYFNITLEAKTLGKLDSESIDYVGTLGLDFMFGGKWHKKAPILEALEKPKVIERAKVKPAVKKIKEAKKQKWITPKVVEEMFDEKDQEKVSKDTSVIKMQKSLKAFKAQMAENEALLAEKLAKLERDLVEKTKQKEQERLHKMKEEKALATEKKLEAETLGKEKKRLLALKAEAESKHLEKMRITQEKIAKAQAAAKALVMKKEVDKQRVKENTLAQLAIERKKAEVLRLKKKEAANKKRLEKIRVAQEKAAKAEAERIAKEERIAAEKELAEYNRVRALQEVEEKKTAELAQLKAEEEKTDKLLIRNGMVVFAD